MKWVNNLAVVVYTNETYFPILELFVQYFRKYCPANPHIYVIANNTTNAPQFDNVTYLNGNCEFDGAGRHFSQTLRNTLPQIPEEYAFWFCEDYILTDMLDVEGLNRLLRLIKDTNIDVFSFASVAHAPDAFTPLEVDYTRYGFNGEKFYITANDYMHKFSVQPCIWKKDKLIQVITENDISLHDMDCTRVKDIEKYFAVCTKYRIYDICPTCPERFIINYMEVIRHGVFLLSWNGAHMQRDWPYHKMLEDVILDNNIDTNPRYKRFLSFDTSIMRDLTSK